MQLSLETYSLIVSYVADRKNLASLCRVSKTFQQIAERKLYNTLVLRGFTHTFSMCRLLSASTRHALLVKALSIYYSEDNSEESDGSVYHVPDDYWDILADTLDQTVKLKHLGIYIETADEAAKSWIFDHCTFQLRSFHCDFPWDNHLSTFLNTQTELSDLYLLDFRNDALDTPTSSLNDHSLPKLSVLECTFMEAAVVLCPGRPISRLKTCFSRSSVLEKRVELNNLLAHLLKSRKPLFTLDIADSSYTPEFSMVLLNSIVNTFANFNNLRYLGTLVLPVEGREVRAILSLIYRDAVSLTSTPTLWPGFTQRISFYSSLMRLHKLQCIEVEVTDWEPPPTSTAALRALTLELRIYCPSISRVVFVHDFDRTVMKMANNLCVVDRATRVETLWRDV